MAELYGVLRDASVWEEDVVDAVVVLQQALFVDGPVLSSGLCDWRFRPLDPRKVYNMHREFVQFCKSVPDVWSPPSAELSMSGWAELLHTEGSAVHFAGAGTSFARVAADDHLGLSVKIMGCGDTVVNAVLFTGESSPIGD
jgi:hypothetical protein